MLQITWLGTAGFILKSQNYSCAFDPFISRNNPQSPSPFKPKDFANIQSIFLGHGHFDHIYDVPQILSECDACVHAASDNIKRLIASGVRSHQASAFQPSQQVSLVQNVPNVKIYGFESRHVRFDMPLVIQTLRQCGFAGCVHIAGLGVKYPQGGVRTYYLELDGKKILFVSSAGCTKEELKKYRDLNLDILMVPLQGHSNIQEIAAEMTAIVNPKTVIPHHHDDFYKPLSQQISLEPFIESLKKKNYSGKFLEIPLFTTLSY